MLSFAVSIHVPARGTTTISINCITVTMFQSTFPRGERLMGEVDARVKKIVSIHVPARGTTKDIREHIARDNVSIHVPARGTTRPPGHAKDNIPVFQSTFPRGERRGSRKCLEIPCHRFNPRSREGNDCLMLRIPPLLVLFQSTFPRGERLFKNFII